MLQHLKQNLLLFIAFILVTQLGMYLNEQFKKTVANTLGYEATYERGLGQYMFDNPTMRTVWEPIKKANLAAIKEKKDFKDKSIWDGILAQQQKDYAYIQLTGLIFTFGISLLGLMLLVQRKNSNTLAYTWQDKLALLLSLFIVKEFVSALYFIVWGHIFCDIAQFAHYFQLPVWGTEWFLLIFSAIFTLYVLYNFVPKKQLLPFFFIGLLGGFVGIYLWFKYIGSWMLGA